MTATFGKIPDFVKQRLKPWLVSRNNQGSIESPSRICFESSKINLEKESRIGSGSIIDADLDIGYFSDIGRNCEFIGGEISIGRYCDIARNVVFQANNHDYNQYPAVNNRLWQERNNITTTVEGSIEVGNDVWIGTRVIILPDVEIADGAVIGAGAVVTKDVESFEVVAGVPAKHVKYRFDSEEDRNRMKQVSWWSNDFQNLESMRFGRGFL